METARQNFKDMMSILQTKVKVSLGKVLFGKQFQAPNYDYLYIANERQADVAARDSTRRE